jgi:hypothetical protein
MSHATSWTRTAATGVALILLSTGCGDGGGSGDVQTDGKQETPGDFTTTDVATFAVSGSPSKQSLEDLQSIIAARLQGLDREGYEMDGFDIDLDDPGVVVVSIGASSTGDAGDVFDLVAEPGELRFRPVLSTIPGASDAMALTPPEEDIVDQPVTLAEHDHAGELIASYQLGPSAATGAIVSAAEPSLENGQWEVRLELTVDGIDEFNAVAAQCNARSESCSTGQLAIVLDSEVITAPSISQPSYDRDAIVVSGTFDEAEARDLALVLRSGALPVALELQHVEHVSD